MDDRVEEPVTHTDPRGDGEFADLTSSGDTHRLVFRRLLRHPREKVWRAITSPEELTYWFPTTIDGDRRAGAALRFEFPAADFDGEVPDGFDGAVIACDEPSLFELMWGDQTLRIELADGPAGPGSTLLTLTVRFDELGIAARDAAGWHVCLRELARLLDVGAPERRSLDGWKVVNEAYNQRFGPEASTVGPPDGVAVD